ncbi:MAG: AraC family transcriptional regulator [Eubacteriales bacterium]|nr:AraC family transcriptional regulator [Eubacteriales bacterium]
MNKKLQSQFLTRQYMLSNDFEIYYYNDLNLQKVALHSHDYYEFYFFLEGDVSIQVGKNVYPVQFGDIMMIPPHIPHRPLIASQDIPYRRFVFWISQDYYQHLVSQTSDYAYLVNYVQSHQTYLFHNDRVSFNSIQSKILRLLEEMRSDRFGRDTQVSLCVNDLILHINRIVHAQNHPHSAAGDRTLYHQLAQFIEEHPEEDLSLERLAGEFYVSKYHISHVFKENLGMSIHQFITKKRLALCREAILGGTGITEAFSSFGFGDYSSFYRAFKKEYGISPKDFRDMQHITLR